MRQRGLQPSADSPAAHREPRRGFFLRIPFTEAEVEHISLVVRQRGQGGLVVNALVHVQSVWSIVFCGVELSEPGNPSVVVLDARVSLADEKTGREVRERVGPNTLPHFSPHLLANVAGKIVIEIRNLCDDVIEDCSIPLVVKPLKEAAVVAAGRQIDNLRHVCYSYSELGRWSACEGAPSCQP
jgi:hypothetical protein